MRVAVGLILTLVLSIPAAGVRRIHRIDILGSNVFLLETDSSLFMIDAGYPGREKTILRELHRLGKPLRLIILTHGHFDHYGCAAAVRRATGAPVAVHFRDAEYVGKGTTPLDSVNFAGFFGKYLLLPIAEKIFRPDTQGADLQLRDFDTLDRYGLRADVIPTPGHTKGSCTIIVQDSIAFVGDLLTAAPVLSKQQFYASSWGQITASVKKLLEHRFDRVYLGHTGRSYDRAAIEKLVKRKTKG